VALVLDTGVLYAAHKFASPQAWTTFCHSIDDGAFTLYPLDASVLVAAAAVQHKYADLPLGLVDASVFVTCERLGERSVATLDRRHFSVLRTAKGHGLTIVP
jgi:predicted nucleic acid-binding protein